VVTVPGNATVEAASSSGKVFTYTASAADIVDGVVLATCTPASGSTFPIGRTTVMCTATDGRGNTGSASFTVTVADTTPPVVTVAGANVSVSATATDTVGVAGVQFMVDGISIGAEDTTSPYSVVWNTTTAPNGSHTVFAVARDAAGNVKASSAVTVVVNNST